MNGQQFGLGAVLLGFTALTGYVLLQHGYLGFVDLMLANTATVLAFVDLVIALSLITFWMWRDARERRVSFLPYFILTAVFGSVGPLLYLIRRSGKEPAQVTQTTPQTARA